MRKMNIFRYIAYSNPEGSRNMLLQKGFTDIPKNYEQVAIGLADYINRDGEAALLDVLKLHPDFDAIKECALKSKAVTGVAEENGGFLYCDKCPLKLSADAEVPAPTVSLEGGVKISEKLTNALIIGGSIVLASTLISIIIVTAIRKS